MRIWWKPMPAMKESDYTLFIHSLDDQGKMVLDRYLPLGAPGESSHGEAFRLDTITFPSSREKSKRLAIGFVRPNQTPLVADKGTRDWDGLRVIVPVP